MSEVTVTCGCGRKMRADGLRGGGAYTCGCGVRIQVNIPPPEPQCAWLSPEGDFARCPRPPIRESTKVGVPLCYQHLDEYGEMRKLTDIMKMVGGVRGWAREIELGIPPPTPEELAEIERKRLDRTVVYYVRIGDLVKIGTTVAMGRRMRGIAPDEILATEPGDHKLERLRHRQFRHLRTGKNGERFRAGSDLMAHIAAVRQEWGEPITTTWGVNSPHVAYPGVLSD